MRTTNTTTTNPNNIAPTKNAAKGKRAKDGEQTNSFDQVLKDRRATTSSKKSESPKRDESPAPANGSAKKSNKSATKSNAKKKATEETDPNATMVEQPKQTKPAKTEEVESTEQTAVEQEDVVTPVEAVESDEQATAEEEPSPLIVQQIADITAVVAPPIEVDAELPANDEPVAIDGDVEPIIAKPLAIAQQQAAQTDEVDAVVESDPEASVAPIDFELPVAEGEIELADDTLVESPEIEFSPLASESTVKQSTTNANTSPIVQPVEPNFAADADDEAADGDEQRSSSAPGVPTNLTDIGGDATTAFDFDSEFSASAKHAEIAPTTHTHESSPTINIVKPEFATPAPQPQSIAQAQPVQSPERLFAADNHAKIVSHVRTNLLPNGGSMQITLNPPELGAIQVAVQMRDGVMNASFATTSDQATRLLSHSLGELRATLENSGVAVDRLHVEQAPKNHQSQNDSNSDRQQQQGSQSGDTPGRREQERRELLQRMWRRLNEGSDPLDMVA